MTFAITRMFKSYYNEIDPYAAQWMRNLIAAGHIAPGDVDERSIVDVSADDLKGYTQCHFFAGIGGWSLAARLAGWPDERRLWTGSPPCQPWSIAGKGEGKADPRDLWPKFFELIRASRPSVVMGEQVAAAVGKHWLDRAGSDLEGIGYACGAAVVPACAVDAPHRRDRLWFVAHPDTSERGADMAARHQFDGSEARRIEGSGDVAERGARLVADASCERRATGWNDDAEHDGTVAASTSEISRARAMAYPHGGNSFWWSGPLQVGWNSIEGQTSPGGDGQRTQWRIKPGLPLLADGVPDRVGRLCAYGNAIVPQVAAEIIGAYLDTQAA